MFHENQMDAAQTLGLIKGLTAVVQEQSNAMKDTTDQIKQLAATVENLTKSQQQSMGLRLPNLVSPEFTGKRAPGSFSQKDPKFINYFKCFRSILADLFKTAVPKKLACIRRTELGTRGTSETVRAGCHESRSCGVQSSFCRVCTGSAGQARDPKGSADPRTFRKHIIQ